MCWINSTEMGFHVSIFQPRACAQDSWEGLAFGQSQKLSLLPHLPKGWALLSIQLSDLRLDLTTALESLQQVTWQSDYSVTQIYFLNKDPAATNYTSFPLTYKAARKLAPGPPAWEALYLCTRQAHCKWCMSCPNKRWDLRPKTEHFLSATSSTLLSESCVRTHPEEQQGKHCQVSTEQIPHYSLGWDI